jgi:hypothetical protein
MNSNRITFILLVLIGVTLLDIIECKAFNVGKSLKLRRTEHKFHRVKQHDSLIRHVDRGKRTSGTTIPMEGGYLTLGAYCTLFL